MSFVVFLLLLSVMVAVGPMVPLLILSTSIRHWRKSRRDRAALAFEVAVSLLIWAVLSGGMLLPFVWMMLAVGQGEPNASVGSGDYWQLLVVVALAIGYGCVGWFLIYMMRRRTDATHASGARGGAT